MARPRATLDDARLVVSFSRFFIRARSYIARIIQRDSMEYQSEHQSGNKKKKSSITLAIRELNELFFFFFLLQYIRADLVVVMNLTFDALRVAEC